MNTGSAFLPVRITLRNGRYRSLFPEFREAVDNLPVRL